MDPLPLPLQRRGTDEFGPPPRGPRERRAVGRCRERAAESAARVGLDRPRYCRDRRGTATALRALNEAWGEEFYAVPEEAERDAAAADAALGGDELVFDVQTHYVAPRAVGRPAAEAVLAFIRSVAPERWKDLRGGLALGLADWLRCVFLESETAVAVLTAAPGEGERNILPNPDSSATRELIDRLGGEGRLLHHAIVHANLPGELDGLEAVCERHRPAGFKVYTLYGDEGSGGWRLDDETSGVPFLERCAALGTRIVCAHKGLSALAPAGSPADVGPAAAGFPELEFLVYHSGYELPVDETGEGAYDPEAEPAGTDRLVRSLADAALAPGANVWAELGSTWFAMLRRPPEAAHVLGKLLRAVGEERILWGTDSVWYGSPQPLIDAFRAFRIPECYRERFGYPELTSRVKERILGRNAASVYGVDPEAARRRARSDDLAWVRAVLKRERG